MGLGIGNGPLYLPNCQSSAVPNIANTGWLEKYTQF